MVHTVSVIHFILRAFVHAGANPQRRGKSLEAQNMGKISLQQFIDRAPLSRRQRLIVVLTFLVMVADGLDTSIVSHIFPKLIANWGISIGDVTIIVTGGLVALAIGGFSAGPAADRWGRKPVLLAGFVLFNVTTAGLGFASTFEAFFGLRLLACVGLGVVMPVCMTMVADWVPTARRAQMVVLTFLGASTGSTVGAYLAASIIPSFGWQTMAVVAGAVPLLIIPFYVSLVPEPPAILIKKGRSPAKLERALSVIAASPDNVDRTVFTSKTVARKNVFAVVFSKTLLVTTLLIWVLTLLAQGIIQIMLQYAPILLQQPSPGPGLTTAESGQVVAMFGWGGIIGVVLFSFVLKWFDRFLTGCIAAGVAILGFCVLAFGNFGLLGLMLVILLAGIGVASLPAITGAITAVAYPAEARATGTGTASVWGRVGGMISGATGGILIAAGFTLQTIFAILTLPATIALLTFLGLRAESRRRDRLSQKNGELPTPTESNQVSSTASSSMH